MENRRDQSNSGRPTMDMQMQNMNSTDEQKLPQHANAVLADMIMQMRNPHMRIEQINGQRSYGPPTDHVGPPPPKGSEVFVENIPLNVFELELAQIFERVGKIFEIRIMMNFSGFNRGYGYVRFCTLEAANKAVSVLNKYEIRQNIHLGVIKSVDNRRLYIRKIPIDKTGEDICDEMVRAGVSGISRVIATSGGGCGGAVFIDFENHMTAALARRSIMLGNTRLWGKHVHVEWARSEPETDILFVRNLAESTTVEQLEELFNANSGGGVRRVCKMESTAYIICETPAQAEQARYALDNLTLDGSCIDVLTVHGSDDMIRNELGKPTELLTVPTSEGIPIGPSTFTAPLAFPNPGYSFPIFGFPGFLPFAGMMTMNRDNGQINENQKGVVEPDNLEQVEE